MAPWNTQGRSAVQLVIEQCAPDLSGLQAGRKLATDGIEGLILPPPLCESKALPELLAGIDMPCVVLGSAAPVQQVCSVGIDDQRAALTMTNHLLDLGHTRIGFIAGDQAHSASARRLKGYEEALAARGLKFAPELVEPGLFTYRSGLDATEKLLRLPVPPSAIFASNDDMAAGCGGRGSQPGSVSAQRPDRLRL